MKHNLWGRIYAPRESRTFYGRFTSPWADKDIELFDAIYVNIKRPLLDEISGPK